MRCTVLYPAKFLECTFFGNTLDWIKDNVLKSLRECIASLWLIEAVNHFLLLLFSQYCRGGNMCSRHLDEQYTPDIPFSFCTALFFILMSFFQMHYILFTLCGVSDQNVLNSFSLPDNSYWKCLQTDMSKSMVFQLRSSRCVQS